LSDSRAALIAHILDLNQRLWRSMQDDQSSDWLSVDLTMPQLKVMLTAFHGGGCTSSQLARVLGVGLSTVTGVVDRLREHGLVARFEDPSDRRVTRVALTEAGQALMHRLHRDATERRQRLLTRLDDDALRTIALATSYMLEAAEAEARSPGDQAELAASGAGSPR
jgi:DNA-binding MarR family transcriptional regulator